MGIYKYGITSSSRKAEARLAKTCNCGSGLFRYDLVDAAGIFCTYVCEKCEDEKRKSYNLEIFNPSGRYASTGDERDI